MTSLFTTTDSAIGLSKISQSDPVVPTPSLMQGLPTGYVIRTFSRVKRLQADAEEIVQLLKRNEDDSNQWLVVLGLSASTIEKLDNDHGSLGGVDYRCQWEGSTGLIKVVPSYTHNITTDQVTRRQTFRNGNPVVDR